MVLPSLSALALSPLFPGVAAGLGEAVGHAALSGVAQTLGNYFRDGSQAIPLALRRASDQAWRAFEVALAGESLWTWLDRGDNKAFRAQVRQFVEESGRLWPDATPEF